MASKVKANTTISQLFQTHKRLKTQPSDGDLLPPSPSPSSDLSIFISEEGGKKDHDLLHVPDQANEDSNRTETMVSKDQKVRMELSKASAHSIRNMKLCENKVSESRAQGMPFPELKTLLVEKSWKEILGDELEKPYMQNLYQFVKQEASKDFPIYPPPAKVFNAFNSCPFDKVKVVILGQDPYHGPGQAMGLCFSVEKGIKFPSSLLNIFKEIRDDLGCSIPSHGNLEKWSHQGWEQYTDATIRALALGRSGIIFLLWGNSAQEKTKLIDARKHHILKAAHPSGLSAHRGFFNCRHFSKTNQILEEQGLLPIDWQI